MADPTIIEGLILTAITGGTAALVSVSSKIAKLDTKVEERFEAFCERLEKVESRLPNGQLDDMNDKLDALLAKKR